MTSKDSEVCRTAPATPGCEVGRKWDLSGTTECPKSKIRCVCKVFSEAFHQMIKSKGIFLVWAWVSPMFLWQDIGKLKRYPPGNWVLHSWEHFTTDTFATLLLWTDLRTTLGPSGSVFHRICRINFPDSTMKTAQLNFSSLIKYSAVLFSWGLLQGNVVQQSIKRWNGVQFRVLKYSAVPCREIQCSAVKCSAVQYSVMQLMAEQCSTVKCSAVQCSAVQCSAVQ